MKDVVQVEKILKALANRRRLAIVSHVQKQPGAKVGDIATHIKLSFKSTSRHLSVLLAAGVLEREQVSLEMHYRLCTPVHPIIKTSLSIL